MNLQLHEPGNTRAVRCDLASDLLRSGGNLRLRVWGWSMLPSVRPGDLLVFEGVKVEAVSEGDIVLFHRDRRLVAHRVVQKLGDSRILTRGDATPAADPVVGENQLLGRVACIVRKGKPIEPRRTLRWSERGIAALVRNAATAVHVMLSRLQTA